MIRIRNIKLSLDCNNEENLKKEAEHILKNKINSFTIKKRSIDAREKSNIIYVYTIDVEVNDENKILKSNRNNNISVKPNEEYKIDITGKIKLNYQPIVIGLGPSGLFVAYILAKYGYKPIIFERGNSIEERVKDINHFWNDNILNPNSNIQFGEGGAGTFSDGKLNTLVNDKMNRDLFVLKTFVECGAPSDILYDSHPHIGTDILQKVIVNMRTKIIEMGGTIKYNSCMTDIITKDDKIKSIVINDANSYPCECLFLCIGHSARDTYKMLYQHKLNMESKPFAIGLRIMHNQEMIDKSMYGDNYNKLPHASYKLTYKTSTGRGVYSFCMCPGGYVVNASSENNRLAINGMSNYDRESGIANSALIVTVSKEDYGDSLFSGIEFQRKLEEKAYSLGKSNIPIQTYGDFLYNINTIKFGSVVPQIKGNYNFTNLNELLPKSIADSLKEAMPEFGKKISGFASNDAILAGVESRTSSPIRILRNDSFMSNIKGIYPCGEGAGYAGGIMTSAMDGLKSCEEFLKVYKY